MARWCPPKAADAAAFWPVSPPCCLDRFRNNLNKIMLTPFNARDDWEMGVQRVGETGCIELRVRETARKVAEEA